MNKIEVNKVECLSALLMYSENPDRLATFYRDNLGIPVAAADHGGHFGQHYEATFKGTHFAIWKTDSVASQSGDPAIAPTFRVRNLTQFISGLKASGVNPIHEPIELGEGKRVVSIHDPDGRLVRFIELGANLDR